MEPTNLTTCIVRLKGALYEGQLLVVKRVELAKSRYAVLEAERSQTRIYARIDQEYSDDSIQLSESDTVEKFIYQNQLYKNFTKLKQ